MKRLAMILLMAVAGCASVPDCDDCCLDDCSRTNLVKTAAVIVSLTEVDPKAYNGWEGDCPGTDIDAAVFTDMCVQFGIPYVKLTNDKATVSGAISAAEAMARRLDGGLLILFFSGHGGQVYAAATGESDGLDETMCLWDGQLRDDHVWSLLVRLPKNVRVWMVTDCCNSGTNYRKPDFAKAIARRARERGKLRVARGLARRAADEEPNLLHWGGCGDGESSFGDDTGGVFTSALVDTFDPRRTYREWFAAAKKRMPRNQTPTVGETGVSFQDTLIFR